MTPEQLAQKITERLGSQVRSVLLYGSAATGDYIAKKSDYNMLVVLDKLDAEVLDALAPITTLWMRRGNPAPMLFTLDQLKKSSDVFPIELADIREHHKLLAGEDVLAGISIDNRDLRLQLERELRTRLIALRERYLAVAGRPAEVLALMTDSLSTFLVLFRAALRLFEEHVPARKLDALTDLVRRMGCSEENLNVFQRLQDIKAGRAKASRREASDLFRKYLRAIEEIVEAVDQYMAKS